MVKYIFILTLMLSGTFSLAQKGKKKTAIDTSEVISYIDSLVQQIDNDDSLRVENNVRTDMSSVDMLKTLKKFNNDGMLVYSYQFEVSGGTKREHIIYFHNSIAIYNKTTIIDMDQEKELDHDGMPILSFPSEKTITYYWSGEVFVQTKEKEDYSNMIRN